MIGIPLVVQGTSGMGKSALLANWSNRFHQHHPESLLVTHFVGCSPASSNYSNLVLRVMRELLALCHDGSTNIPNDPQAAIGMSLRHIIILYELLFTWVIIEEFPKFLDETLARNKRSQLVLIIDGLGIYC